MTGMSARLIGMKEKNTGHDRAASMMRRLDALCFFFYLFRIVFLAKPDYSYNLEIAMGVELYETN